MPASLRALIRRAVSPDRPPPPSEDGQAIVLGALSMLVLALMVMLSFNLSQAIHEKIRLQQHADAQAYSMAVVEARAMNYLAYSNRAMAAGYVAMTSLHAYMAAMSVTSSMFSAGERNFNAFAAAEALMCACCGPHSPGCCVHCIHAMQARMNAQKHAQKAREWGNKVKSLDPKFRDAVDAMDRAIDAIHASQLLVLEQTSQILLTGLDEVRDSNAPQASQVRQAVGALNVLELSCALEGTPLPRCTAVRETPLDYRKKVMTEVVNASRPEWPAHRAPVDGVPGALSTEFLQSLLMDVPDNFSLTYDHKGTAKMIDGGSRDVESRSGGMDGGTCGADEHGKLTSMWKYHGLMFQSSYEAKVFTDADGSGQHTPGAAHSGQHTWEGVDSRQTCTAQGNCFVKFRPSTSRKDDFGQPRVYAYVTQQLRVDPDGRRAPWEVNDSGEVSITHGEQGEATLRLAPGEGAAVAKALVYYHRLGDWREHPNLFNPYWRAKLHPFTVEEARRVFGAASDTEAANLAGVAPMN